MVVKEREFEQDVATDKNRRTETRSVADLAGSNKGAITYLAD
jgi:hypothetical protein